MGINKLIVNFGLEFSFCEKNTKFLHYQLLVYLVHFNCREFSLTPAKKKPK